MFSRLEERVRIAGGSPTEVAGVRKLSQKGLVPHLSLQISNSPETCALPCRTGPLASPSTNVQECVPSSGVVVALGLATVVVWHSSPSANSAASRAALPADNSPICTRPRPWTLGDPRHHPTSACYDPHNGSCFFLCLTSLN